MIVNMLPGWALVVYVEAAHGSRRKVGIPVSANLGPEGLPYMIYDNGREFVYGYKVSTTLDPLDAYAVIGNW